MGNYDQDAVLIQLTGRQSDPASMPRYDVTFNTKLGQSSITAIEGTLASTGIGGWTWRRTGNKMSLMMVGVAQWGETRQSFIHKTSNAFYDLKNAGFDFAVSDRYVTPLVMERK